MLALTVTLLGTVRRRAGTAPSGRPEGVRRADRRRSRAKPPRRPPRTRRRPSARGASAPRINASSLAATACSSSSPTLWPSVSLIALKLSRSMNSAATGAWLREARASICSARSRISVRFGQAGQRIVRRHEGELLLAARELLVGSLALLLEAFADLQDAELEAQLQHVQCPIQRLLSDAQLRGAFAQDLGHHVSPPQAAPVHLVQRRSPMRRQLAEDPRAGATGLVRDLESVARDPTRDRSRRHPRRSPQSCSAPSGSTIWPDLFRMRDRPLEHLRTSRERSLAQSPQVGLQRFARRLRALDVLLVWFQVGQLLARSHF